MEEFNNCVICDEPLNAKTVIVQEKVILKFIESSIARDDGKTDCFKDRKEIKVHKTCRNTYNNPKCIEAEKKRKKKQSEKVPESVSGFDFQNKCLFCDKDFERKPSKQPSTSRILVGQVKRLDTQDSILKACSAHDDDWSKQVLLRINKVNILEKNARYHYNCYSKFCNSYRAAGLKRGRHQSQASETAMDHVFKFIEGNNHEDCQFSLLEIREALNNVTLPSDAMMKYHLKQKYGDKIIITSGNPSIICFLANRLQKIQNSWYENRENNDNLEKLRIVEMAGKIILQDIESRPYETDMYPSPSNFLDSMSNDCPESLLLLLKTIIMRNNNKDHLERKCLSIAHTVISAARPRSFRSPILLGLGSLIHHKYGSRYLIDLLSNLGFCVNYDETLKFEVSAIATCVPKYEMPQFSQFVYDNADVNANTLDRRDALHTMGGIQCVNPAQTSSFSERIPCLKYIPQGFLRRFDQVPMQTYQKPIKSGLDNTLYKAQLIEEEFELSSTDFMWLYGKSQELEVPGWQSFMIARHKDEVKHEHVTEVQPLPIINAPASNYNTILSALCYSVEQCRQNNIDCCIVTFDQPLYNKAQEIVKSSQDPMVQNIIVRLGGFHLLMSFMGAVGTIMKGSGLKELWLCAYAEGSIEKMMAGHHYERAVRAHMLSVVALFGMIKNNIELTLEEKLQLDTALHEILENKKISETEKADLVTIKNKFDLTLQKLESRGPTAQLWVSYFKMIMLVQQFIKAERTGDWFLHLDTIKRMLPYFHAAGHFNYSKSANLYVQEMICVHEKMTPGYYEKFVKEGLFTIKRTKKPCSGTWTDMTIEQSLMSSMKTAGRLIQGRGYTDDVFGKWVLGLPIFHCITETVENFCDFGLKGDRLHKDGTKSRMEKDAKDISQFMDWFSAHDPFPVTEDIMSISTGIVGNKDVNPHKAKNIGQTMMIVPDGTTYGQIKYSRKGTIKSLATVSSAVTVQDVLVPIEPDQIFKRISFIKKTQKELKEFLKHELSPYPLSLFNQSGMRKSNKSILYDMFTPVSEETINDGTRAYVIDGRYLLHKVVWQKGCTFENICRKYVNYIKTHYSNATVVFDGYDNELNVTNQERKRRAAKGKFGPEIVILNSQTEATVTQESFFSNEKNKSCFISLLTPYLAAEGISVYQSSDDADTLIVTKAAEKSQKTKFDHVIIVGEDVDLLAILTRINLSNLYLLKPGKEGVCTKLYNAKSFTGDPESILFCHAFTGCDSTSAIYQQGKKKACSLIAKNDALRSVTSVFNDAQATPDEIASAGEIFICHLYGNETADINSLRYEKFSQLITKNKLDLASLPPSKSAARMHSLRTYYQIQKWMSNDLDPTGWGWDRNRSILSPILTLDKPVPDEIMKMISCKCKSTCKRNCICIQSGLPCSQLCKYCTDKVCNGEKNDSEEAEYDASIEVEINKLERQDVPDKSKQRSHGSEEEIVKTLATNVTSSPTTSKTINEICFEWIDMDLISTSDSDQQVKKQKLF